MDHEGAIGAPADVKLDPVGTHPARLTEGFHGVFRLDSRGAPMGQYGDHAIFSQVFRNEILAMGGPALYDLTYMR
jgi:hypothetical protein